MSLSLDQTKHAQKAFFSRKSNDGTHSPPHLNTRNVSLTHVLRHLQSWAKYLE